jgi:hypothetical protein
MKCKECRSCLDTVIIPPRRFYHCFLCDIYSERKNGKMLIVDIVKETGISKEILDKMYKETSK